MVDVCNNPEMERLWDEFVTNNNRLLDCKENDDKEHPLCLIHPVFSSGSSKTRVTVHTTRSLCVVFLLSIITKVHIMIIDIDPNSSNFASEHCSADGTSIVGINAYESFNGFESFEVLFSHGNGFSSKSAETFDGDYTLPEDKMYSVCVPNRYLRKENWPFNKCSQCSH